MFDMRSVTAFENTVDNILFNQLVASAARAKPDVAKRQAHEG
jgi:hypothetical protein